MSVKDRLKELGVELPASTPPAAAYTPCVRANGFLFTAGQTPKINGVPFDGTSDISIDAGLMDKKNLLVTLIAKDWGGDRTYKISHPLIKKTTDILMIPQVGTSQTVYSMISDACITCAEQEDGYIVLKALGTPPDQDVNVNLLML